MCVKLFFHISMNSKVKISLTHHFVILNIHDKAAGLEQVFSRQSDIKDKSIADCTIPTSMC